MKLDIVESPCIGRCSTTYGGDECRGCFRTVEQIRDWFQLPNDQLIEIQKQRFLKIETIAAEHAQVDDLDALERALEKYHVRYYADAPALVQVVDILRGRNGVIDGFVEDGFSPLQAGISSADLFNKIETALRNSVDI
ncbi:DUF1289 domain-containing protein [Pelagibaculum spongiae]|uniref:DUF1289 domain-containing protein n=1 Tax=Pelagibaculum spongiae TaxID=2080658 RepID=A0A2V1H6C1_9GAMM|nr:DUF1289 domain-containing protein [Pelagibaculum spongiae]PVZ71972.1 hypothetical protein DC094_02820 [Pelagibaculum spongiae]